MSSWFSILVVNEGKRGSVVSVKGGLEKLKPTKHPRDKTVHRNLFHHVVLRSSTTVFIRRAGIKRAQDANSYQCVPHRTAQSILHTKEDCAIEARCSTVEGNGQPCSYHAVPMSYQSLFWVPLLQIYWL